MSFEYRDTTKCQKSSSCLHSTSDLYDSGDWVLYTKRTFDGCPPTSTVYQSGATGDVAWRLAYATGDVDNPEE